MLKPKYDINDCVEINKDLICKIHRIEIVITKDGSYVRYVNTAGKFFNENEITNYFEEKSKVDF